MRALINIQQIKFHHLAQFLAGFNNSYLPKAADDSQSNMAWSVARSALLSRKYNGVHLELNFPDITLKVISEKKEFLTDLLGLEKSGITSWLTESISAAGLDPGKLNFNNHYTLPTAFDTFISVDSEEEKAILQLVEERNIAQRALENIKNEFGDKASEIRVWPHHFDTGMLLDKKTDTANVEGYGLGYAIADKVANVPYFYAYARGEQDIDYQNMPPKETGIWVSTNHWSGAILPVDTPFDLKTVTEFYREYIDLINTGKENL